jgi:hypothetical protein
MKRLSRKAVLLGASAILLGVVYLRGQAPAPAQTAMDSGTAPAVAPSLSSPSSVAADEKGSEIFSKLVEWNDERTRRLERYTGLRQYELRNDKDQLSARAVVRVEFRAPDTKTFETVSEEGSKWIGKFVFKRLISSETEAAAGREHRNSSVTPRNYTFRYLGEQNLDGSPCYVVYATPKRIDKYMFEGQVWIDSREYAVTKIAGHPAKNPSFWIKRVDWVRRYGKFGDFWLPVEDETLTDLRILGKKKLSINYQDYVVNQTAAEIQG